MFSEAQYTDTEILIYSYFVDQEPLLEEEKTPSYPTHVFEENGVYYCATTTENGVYWYVYCLNPLIYTDPSGEFLTWGVSNGGFSIGFNLTPLGIPLGAGINIGWGGGFSVGGYGEVGYRVGGTAGPTHIKI